MRIMMVDDDCAFLRSMWILLAGLGHDVRAFFHAGKACEYLADGGDPQLLILDYSMPQMSGLDFLSRVGAHLSETCRVIMITGHLDLVASDAHWRPPRIAEVLVKPVDATKLHEALARVDDGGA